MGRHLVKHGDAVKDIAFQVEDCNFLVKVTVFSSSKSVRATLQYDPCVYFVLDTLHAVHLYTAENKVNKYRSVNINVYLVEAT